MMSTRSARMLARYNAWADKVMYDAVAALPPGEAAKERTSLFKNIVHTLNHIYVIDRIWQAHLEGRDHGYTARNTPGHPPLDELWGMQQEIDDWYIRWSDGMNDAALEEKVRFTLIGGNQGEMTRGEILMHVVTHSSYHRGYAGDLMFQVPTRAPQMDLPVFLREARPQLD